MTCIFTLGVKRPKERLLRRPLLIQRIMAKLPDQETLKGLLRYEERTGKLFWLRRGDNPWDARFAGKEALYAKHSCGYLSGALLGRQVYAHRVIWKLVYGDEPKVIDHLDGDRRNNALANLRGVTQRINMKNKARHSTNKSGVPGVYWHKPSMKWFAQFRSEGTSISRTFDDLESAKAWKAGLASMAGYTERHCA